MRKTELTEWSALVSETILRALRHIYPEVHVVGLKIHTEIPHSERFSDDQYRVAIVEAKIIPDHQSSMIKIRSKILMCLVGNWKIRSTFIVWEPGRHHHVTADYGDIGATITYHTDPNITK